jgi:hypothetical protein
MLQHRFPKVTELTSLGPPKLSGGSVTARMIALNEVGAGTPRWKLNLNAHPYGDPHPAPDVKFSAADVWSVLESARGQCEYCGSLAVENRPSGPDGRPLTWSQVGRRIGSLGHRVARFNGGSNAPGNLGWVCLWCNTWPTERRPGAPDHGGIQPLPD